MRVSMTMPAAVVLMALAACGGEGSAADAGLDTDTGYEPEPGVDTDTGTGSGGTGPGNPEPDPCVNGWGFDTFNPDNCPESEPEEDCVRFVDVQSEAESQDGLSWETAFRDVQRGIDSARCAALESGACSVWVAAGRYHVYRHKRQETIRLRPAVAVFGGFVGTETALEERDFAQNETILDGRESEEGPCHVFHVVTGSDDAVLDGVTVTGGRAKYVQGIEHSEDGGGMLNVDASPTVRNCVFVANEADRYGGGMRTLRGSPVVTDCLFEENEVGWWGCGGGMSIYESAPNGPPASVENCVFIGNTAPDGGGGGLCVKRASAVIADCEFLSNEASGSAAVSLRISAASGHRVDVLRSVFIENKSKAGGSAVGVTGSGEVLVQGCAFYDNIGGGLGTHISAPLVENCVFTGNKGQLNGAIRNFRGRARLVNCTISGNFASLPGGAGGVFSENLDEPCGQQCPEVVNSIVWGNGPVNIKDTAGSVTAVSFSDVGGGWPGLGNIDADPMFENASGQVFRLLGTSPCIDAANGPVAPEFDFDGNERYDEPAVPNTGLGPPWADMGAFEYGRPEPEGEEP